MTTAMVAYQGDWNETTLDEITLKLAVRHGDLVPIQHAEPYDDGLPSYEATSLEALDRLHFVELHGRKPLEEESQMETARR